MFLRPQPVPCRPYLHVTQSVTSSGRTKPTARAFHPTSPRLPATDTSLSANLNSPHPSSLPSRFRIAATIHGHSNAAMASAYDAFSTTPTPARAKTDFHLHIRTRIAATIASLHRASHKAV